MSTVTSEIVGRKQLAWGKQKPSKSSEGSDPMRGSTVSSILASPSTELTPLEERSHTQRPLHNQAPFSKLILSTAKKIAYNEGLVTENGNVEIARLRALVPKPPDGVLSANRGNQRIKLSQIAYKKRTKLLFSPTAPNSSIKRFVNDDFVESQSPIPGPPRTSHVLFEKQQNPNRISSPSPPALHFVKKNDRNNTPARFSAPKRWQIPKSDQALQCSQDVTTQKPQTSSTEKPSEIILGLYRDMDLTPDNNKYPPAISLPPSKPVSCGSHPSPQILCGIKVDTRTPLLASPLLLPKPSTLDINKNFSAPKDIPENFETLQLQDEHLKPLDTSPYIATLDITPKPVSMQFFLMTDDEKVGFWDNYFKMADPAEKQACGSSP